MSDRKSTVSLDHIEVAIADEHYLATRINSLWENFRYSSGYIQRADDVSEVKRFLNATSTYDTSNVYNDQSHTTHRPKIAQIADTLEAHYVSSLLPTDDWMTFTPDEEDSADIVDRKKIESYIRNRHRLYDHRSIITKVLRDWIEDIAIVEVVWTAETANNEVKGMPIKGYVGPKIRRLDFERMAFDPRARSFDDSWKIIQSVKTYGDIAQEIEDETYPESYREVLKDAMLFRQYYREHPDVFGEDWADAEYSGWGTNDFYFRISESVEILTFYGTLYDVNKEELIVNQKIVIIDRKWLLLQEPVNTWNGKPHIFMSSWRDRPKNLIGMSPLENLTGMQFAINHLQNTRADALDTLLHPDRVQTMIDDERREEDGSLTYFSNEPGGNVRNIAPDANIAHTEADIEALERKMEEYAGVPRSAAGIKVPGEQTKFEVQTLRDAGTLLFQSKIKKFEKDILEKCLNAELELARSNLDENLRILVDRPEGQVFDTIGPDLMEKKGTLVARGASHFIQQSRIVQELTQFLQNLQAVPGLANHFPADRIAQAYNRLLGSFGSNDGLYEKFGAIAEAVEAAQVQQGAAREIDQSAIAVEQLDNPDLDQEENPDDTAVLR